MVMKIYFDDLLVTHLSLMVIVGFAKFHFR